MTTELSQAQTLLEKAKPKKLVKLNIEDMVRAHPTIKGVLTKFHSHVEKYEPVKTKRPKLSVHVNDVANMGASLGINTNNIDEQCRLLTVEVALIIPQDTITSMPEGRNVLVRQSAKVSPSLGTFMEGDEESERDVALAVEGLVSIVVIELATAGVFSVMNR